MPTQCLLCLFVAILLSGCAASQPSVVNETPSSVQTPAVDIRETASCAADATRYRGLKCNWVRLGVSLSCFRDEARKNHLFMSEESTKYPTIMKKFSVRELSAPVKGVKWTPCVKFVDDGNVFRLYEVEGLVESVEGSVAPKLSKQFGMSKQEGQAQKWFRGGTKLRLINDGTQQLISFTDDKLIDVSSEKMVQVLDAGNYGR